MAQHYLRLRDLATTPTRAGRYPVSPSTVWRWLRAGLLPAPMKLGGATVWSLAALEEFERSRGYSPNVAGTAKAGAAGVAARRAGIV